MPDEKVAGLPAASPLDYRRRPDDGLRPPTAAWAILAAFALVALAAPIELARVACLNYRAGLPLSAWRLPDWFAIPAMQWSTQDWLPWLEAYEPFAVCVGAAGAAVLIFVSCAVSAVRPKVGRAIMVMAASVLCATFLGASWRESSWAFSIFSGVRSLQFEHLPWEGVAALAEATWLPTAMVGLFATRTLEARRRWLAMSLLVFGLVLGFCTLCGVGRHDVAQPLRSIDRASSETRYWQWESTLNASRVGRRLVAGRFIAAGVLATLMIATSVATLRRSMRWYSNVVVTGTLLFAFHGIATATLIVGAIKATPSASLSSYFWYHDARGAALVEATRTAAGAAFGLLLIASAQQRPTRSESGNRPRT